MGCMVPSIPTKETDGRVDGPVIGSMYNPTLGRMVVTSGEHEGSVYHLLGTAERTHPVKDQMHPYQIRQPAGDDCWHRPEGMIGKALPKWGGSPHNWVVRQARSPSTPKEGTAFRPPRLPRCQQFSGTVHDMKQKACECLPGSSEWSLTLNPCC